MDYVVDKNIKVAGQSSVGQYQCRVLDVGKKRK